ncbi:carboxypeptidase-like regulatory domain-containing protein [Pedobacter sp. Hv1]|uniref:carboxypeptidase-like regulatory domain-containing protein n=1 Tax=Pedobacter sp. Hv1 TaxID=1740090 RepID=UPI0006D88B52|nr:carboxypeptidase-like regulatory domain-containing protein [Pedobacter sp. Hv1]KQC02633.1 hypothetical protein AQF98_03395 [Pedobacter sp. Hv1]
MRLKIVSTVILFVFLGLKVQAQVSGLVFDRSSRKPMAKVDVFNLNNQTQTISNAKGEFNIKAAVNDLLVFSMPGYRPDTVFLIDLKPMRRYLEVAVNTLNTISVVEKTNIREQYAQTFNKANGVLLQKGRGLLLYPSTLFSREGRQARHFKRLLKQDEQEKKIDQRFNVKTITAYLPLKQPELDAFIFLYRPTLKFVTKASADEFKFYLMDSYNKFKLLPPEKKIITSLKAKDIE